jgi:hypothetical protein
MMLVPEAGFVADGNDAARGEGDRRGPGLRRIARPDTAARQDQAGLRRRCGRHGSGRETSGEGDADRRGKDGIRHGGPR